MIFQNEQNIDFEKINFYIQYKDSTNAKLEFSVEYLQGKQAQLSFWCLVNNPDIEIPEFFIAKFKNLEIFKCKIILTSDERLVLRNENQYSSDLSNNKFEISNCSNFARDFELLFEDDDENFFFQHSYIINAKSEMRFDTRKNFNFPISNQDKYYKLKFKQNEKEQISRVKVEATESKLQIEFCNKIYNEKFQNISIDIYNEHSNILGPFEFKTCEDYVSDGDKISIENFHYEKSRIDAEIVHLKAEENKLSFYLNVRCKFAFISEILLLKIAHVI